MQKQFSRTALLFSEEALDSLKDRRVALFGVGGVGGGALEALVRSGIGTIDLIDADTVDETNLNRQLISLHSTIGMDKVEAAKQRALDINPEVKVNTYKCFYLPDKKEQFPFDEWDYILDCIDTVSAKIDIIQEAKNRNIPIISAMGCGNRTNPEKLKIADLFETSGDPLSKVMRHELRKRNIDSLTIVYSTQKPYVPKEATEPLPQGKKSIPGSSPFVPPVAGFYMAYKVIKDLLNIEE